MRAPAPAPPRGFRKAIPLKVKLEAVLRHGPVFDEDGNRVCKIEDLDFDHQPPLQLRVYDPEAEDTIPAANDPEHIVPMARAIHREKTAKKDVPEIAKTKRISAKQSEFVSRLLKKECGVKPKRKGTIKSAGFRRKHDRS